MAAASKIRCRSLMYIVELSLLLCIGVFVGICFGDDEAKKKDAKDDGIKTVKKDGYWEKVDPNVDYKDRLPRIAPCEPAESMKGFHLIPGLRLDLVAAEPLVRDAVDMCFDADGRMYVAEMIPYAENNSAEFGSPNGSVSLLEDTDGDGKFEKSTVFADKLVWPTGLTCFDGGVFIVSAPDLWYCKDTDGDAVADVRELVITGFGLSNPNEVPSSLRWALDNRIHGMPSKVGCKLQAVKWEQGDEKRKAKPISGRGRDFSINPRTGQLRLESGGSQFGMTFDQWGCKFESSNSRPIEMVMYEDRYIARNPYLAAPSARINIWKDGSQVYRTSPVEPWRLLRTEMRQKGIFAGGAGGKASGYFTGACGVTIYTGDAWPEQFHGNSFTAEGASNIVHRLRLEPAGVEFAAYRTEQKKEFLASDEIWFRPIQFTVGPDGNLYMADMYREVYEHPGAVPPSAKKHIDLSTGNDRGRIYRIAPEGFKQPKPVRLSKASTGELVALLAHPNFWHRNTAARLLYERQDKKAIEPLVKLTAGPDSALGRMHAMYVLDGLGALSADVVLPRLDDNHPRVREHAVLLSEKVLADSPAVREKLYAMTGDKDMRVRYQLAFTLGEIPGPRATAAMGAIIARNVNYGWIRLAVLSSSLGRTGDLFAILADDRKYRSTDDGRKFLEQLAEQTGLQNRKDQVAEVLKMLNTFSNDEKKLAQGTVRGLSNGLTAAKSPLLARLVSGDDTLAGKLLGEMVEEAKQLAADTEKPVKRRVEAIRSLATATLDDVGEVLAELLESRQPQAIQSAAIDTLGRYKDTVVAEMIVEAWSGFSPQVQDAAIEVLFARGERLSILLTAVEEEEILPSQLDPARIQYLLSHPDKEISEKATELLGGVKLARREEIVAAYNDVLDMKGDCERGKAVFKKECSTCHMLENVGFDLGLPLGSIKNRGPETILISTLDPNREVQPQYLNYVCITDDGLSVTGMISAESATSITLTRAEGESDTVLRTNIDELANSGMSIMPEGLEKQLSKNDMADLIEYLMSIQ